MRDIPIKHFDFSSQHFLKPLWNLPLFKKMMQLILRKPKTLPCSSWCITPTRLGSSPHQNIHNSLQSGLTSRRHTHSKLACRQRMKLNRIGSSWAGAEIMGPQSPWPPKLYLRHLIPVSSACKKNKTIAIVLIFLFYYRTLKVDFYTDKQIC